MTKVSIIVPVYNVSMFLDKCLNSLVNQTIDDYEVIVVNDGTLDNSQEIIDDYLLKYPNIIKSFIKENGGLSSARNYGIEKANGEYIGFIDGDDYVENLMFEKLYNKAISRNFDVVVCNVNYVYGNKCKKVLANVDDDKLSKLDVKKSMVNIYPAAWNKIYKRSLFENGVMFKKNVWYEDVEFLYRLFPYINSIGVVSDYLINYVQRDGAITRTFDKRLYNYIDNFNGVVDYYKNNNFYAYYYNELEYVYVRYLYATFIMGATNFQKKDFNNAVTSAIENVRKEFPKYRHNKLFYSSVKGIYLLTFSRLSANIVYFVKNFKRR